MKFKSALLLIALIFLFVPVYQQVSGKTPPGIMKKMDDPKFSDKFAPTPVPSPSPNPTPTTISNFKFGVVVNDYANKTGELSSLEQQLGKPISTVSIFKQFGLKFNNALVLDDLSYIKSKNMKLQLAWEPWNPTQGLNQTTDYLAEIPQGKHDTYIKSLASSIKTYANPVVLRFGHEMNGNWYPWGNRPSEYISAYRHIHNLFKAEGVTNVTWMWSINADNVPLSPIASVSNFYPGDDVVNMIGIDGFNFGTSTSFGSWRSFKDIFNPAYNYLSQTYQKPIVISETASTETGGSKSLWVENMFKVELPTYFPEVKELVWFNLLKETDWRINSSDASLQSFQKNLP